MTQATGILAQMAALAEPTRARALRLLEDHELTVAELCAVLQLPQSTVSRHLKVLGDEGWVAGRRNGTSRLYALSLEELDPSAGRLWQLIREQTADMADVEQDAGRLAEVLARRQTRSQAFFASAAGRWDRMRQDLFGSRFDTVGLLGLLDANWTVGDLGCGTGQIAEILGPFVGRLIAVDSSAAMLKAARSRLGRLENVEVRRGELESLPMDDGELDAAVISLALHHLPDPGKALAEAARVLKPGGRMLIVDMCPHDRREYRRQMGHIWLGFEADQLRAWLAEAGCELVACRELPADPAAKGPNLFAATATRIARTKRSRSKPSRSTT